MGTSLDENRNIEKNPKSWELNFQNTTLLVFGEQENTSIPVFGN
jgi:hypothetical protein